MGACTVKIKIYNLLTILAVGAGLYAMGYFIAWAWDNADTRIHAEERQCARQGGTLADSSSGFICIVPMEHTK